MEVCVDNKDIYFVYSCEAYWDGKLERIIHDPKRKYKEYSIIGGKVTSHGTKLRLHVFGIEDMICYNPDIPIDLSELNENQRQDWERWIAQWRREIKEIIEEVNRKYKEDSKKDI